MVEVHGLDFGSLFLCGCSALIFGGKQEKIWRERRFKREIFGGNLKRIFHASCAPKPKSNARQSIYQQQEARP